MKRAEKQPRFQHYKLRRTAPIQGISLATWLKKKHRRTGTYTVARRLVSVVLDHKSACVQAGSDQSLLSK